MNRLARNLGTLAATLIIAGGNAWGITAEEKCEATKNKVAGKYTFCRLNAEAKAIKNGLTPDYSKCDEKLVDKWAKEEQKAIAKGTSCIDSVTASEIQTFVTGHSNAVANALSGGALTVFPASAQTTAFGPGSDGADQAGAPLSYVDGGDGTVTDLNTGLIWEKKDDAGGIHDKDNTYTWCADATPGTEPCDNPANLMDGTIVTTFLATLNGTCDGDESTPCTQNSPDCDGIGNGLCGHAGHTDWRIPNVKELQSIVDYEVAYPGPSVDDAFDTACAPGCTVDGSGGPICSCTAAGTPAEYYWASSTETGFPGYAWNLLFSDGNVDNDLKGTAYFARAVRGGD